MNGFILLIPALTFGQVDAAWATRDNVDKEWVLRIDPQVLDWLREGKYKEVASNIDDREPGANRLRIRFTKPGVPANPNVEILTSQTTAEIVANWQKTVDEKTKAEVREFVVQVTPGLIRTLQTGRYEILEPIPVQAGAIRQFRLVIVDPALAQQPTQQPAPLNQQPITQTTTAPPNTNPATPFTPRPPGQLGPVVNTGQVPVGQGNVPNATQFQPSVTSVSTTLPQTQVGQNNFTPPMNPQPGNVNNQAVTNPNYRPNANYNPNIGVNTRPYGSPGGVNYGTAPNYNANVNNPNMVTRPNYVTNGGQPQLPTGYPQQQGWNQQQPPVGNYQQPGQQNNYRPPSQTQMAQLPAGQQGYVNNGQPPVTGATTGQLPNYATTNDHRGDLSTGRQGDGERVNQVSREAAEDVAARTKEATSDFFWLMIFLFLSIGFNIYLVWVAWQTYWKYRDLVSDTRAPRPAGADGY